MSSRNHSPQTVLSGADYLALEDDEQWILEPFLPAEGLVNLFGKPKSGKSFAALGIAIAISSGQPEWNGYKVHRHGPVMYLQLDTPRAEWRRRAKHITAAGYNFDNIFFADKKMVPYPFNILLPDHRRWLQQQVDMVNPVFTVIDTLREAHEGDENNSTDMKRVVNYFVDICRDSALAFISHSRKDSAWSQQAGDDLMDEGRGSSYVAGRMDTMLKFTQTKNKKTGHMYYKGRSVEEGSIKIYQDEATGLIFQDGKDAKLEQITLQVIKDMKDDPKVSARRMMREIVLRMKEFGSVSESTAYRKIKEMTGLIEEEDKSSTEIGTEG